MANVLETSMNFLQTQDPEIAACIENEFHRQKQNIELIASENIASPAVIAAMGSVLTNKYAEGYPGKRYYGGCDYVDVLENIAMERAKALFGAAYANVQPHSGAQANLEVYAALLQPGDTLTSIAASAAFMFSSFTSKISSTSAASAFSRSISFCTFPPSARLIEPIIMDFPAPVSPERMFNPSPNSTSASSISARFFTCKLRNIYSPSSYSSSSLRSLPIKETVSSTVRTAHMIVSSPAILPTIS